MTSFHLFKHSPRGQRKEPSPVRRSLPLTFFALFLCSAASDSFADPDPSVLEPRQRTISLATSTTRRTLASDRRSRASTLKSAISVKVLPFVNLHDIYLPPDSRTACPEFSPCSNCGSDVAFCYSPFAETETQHRRQQAGETGARDGYPSTPDVALLENVFLDSDGHVFNATHRFLYGGWTEASKDKIVAGFRAGTSVMEVDEIVNVAVSPKAEESRHSLVDIALRLPLFLRLSPLMPRLKQEDVPFFFRAHKMIRMSLGHLLGISPWQHQMTPLDGNVSLLFVRRLIQPIHSNFSSASDTHLWQQLRSRFLLPPGNLPLFHENWTLRVPAPPTTAQQRQLAEDGREVFPDDWAAVVALPPASLEVEFRQREFVAMPWLTLQGLSAAEFWRDHVVLFDDSLPKEQALALFRRTAVLITAPGSSLSYLPFMPQGSVVVLMNPELHEPEEQAALDPSAYLIEARLEPLAFALANVLDIHFLQAPCHHSTGPGGAPLGTVRCEQSDAGHTVAVAATHLYESALLPGFERRQWVKQSMPGTGVNTSDGMRAFSAWRHCVVERGTWVRDPLPRRLGWGRPNVYNPGPCDDNFLSHDDANAIADSVKTLVAEVDKAREKGEEVELSVEHKEKLQKAEQEWSVRESLKYRWDVPRQECEAVVSKWSKGGESDRGTSPVWDAFSPLGFCKALPGKKKILFLGDSMSQQMSNALVNNLLRDVAYLRRGMPPDDVFRLSVPDVCMAGLEEFKGISERAVCFRVELRLVGRGEDGGQETCNMEVLFVRNERLRLGKEGLKGSFVWRSAPFYEGVRSLLDSADVIVFNRGAHVTPNNQFERELRAVGRFLRERYPDKPIIWRSHPPGHANCTDIFRPLDAPQDPDTLPARFNWNAFNEQGKIAEAISKELGFVFLDAYTLGLLRGDGHKGLSISTKGKEVVDCLHYCLPGPLDVWVEMLYNILRVFRWGERASSSPI